METFSILLDLCEGNPSVTSGFPSQRAVTQNFDIFFDLNNWMSKQLRHQPFEMPLHWLCHCNESNFIWKSKIFIQENTSVVSRMAAILSWPEYVKIGKHLLEVSELTLLPFLLFQVSWQCSWWKCILVSIFDIHILCFRFDYSFGPWFSGNPWGLIPEHKIFFSASLHFNRFKKDVRIGLLQLNMIYEGQETSASILST